MALLDKTLKQRIVGALVLVALGVIFLPMLFNYEGAAERVRIDAPEMPRLPEAPQIETEPVTFDDEPTSEPVTMPEDWLDAEITPPAETGQGAAQPATPPAAPAPQPDAPAAQTPPPAQPPAAQPQQPVASGNWSVQLASLSNREGADTLMKTLRSQGYNAYLSAYEGKTRVLVGPVVERAEAERLRDQINRQNKLDGFVVRFQSGN